MTRVGIAGVELGLFLASRFLASRFLASRFLASRQGEFAAVDPALERLLGRPPTPFRDVLAASLPR